MLPQFGLCLPHKVVTAKKTKIKAHSIENSHFEIVTRDFAL